MLVPRPPHDAHRRRVGRRAPTPTITADRRLARPCGEQKFGSLRACRMLCDVWTLARNARKLAFHPWARGRTAVVGSLCDAPIGSSTSSPATSQHGSSIDGSLLSMLLAFCTASPGSLRRPAGPARTASGAMALLSTYLFDACRLSNLVAGGRPAWRAARWQPAQYALDSDFCLAALTAAASGAGASRHASPVLSTPATRVSARRPRRPRRARMARRSSGACPAGCAGQSASLRAPPPLRGAATGAAAVNTAAVYVTIASLRRRSRRRRSPLAAALPCPALPSHKQTHTHTHTYRHTYRHTKHTLPQPRAPRASRLTPCASRRASHARPAPRAPSPRASRLPPHPLRHFSSLLLADSSFPRMTDDYPSFGDSSLFGANVYYRGTVALGRTGMIPAAHVYEGGLRKVDMPGMSGD